MLKRIAFTVLCLLALNSFANADETIQINNMLGREVCEFYISANAENDWGDDLLESLDKCLKHGQYWKITWNEDGNDDLTYDLRIVFRNGEDWIIENSKVHWAHNNGVTVINLNR